MRQRVGSSRRAIPPRPEDAVSHAKRMKPHHLLFFVCTCVLLIACGEKQTTDTPTLTNNTSSQGSPTLCSLVSAADIQTAFGQTVTATTNTTDICDYSNSRFSIRLILVDYPNVEAAKQGFQTLFAGKTSIANLGDEANSFRRGREIDKVSLRQGQRVLSISKTGGEYTEDGLQKLEALLRQAHRQLN